MTSHQSHRRSAGWTPTLLVAVAALTLSPSPARAQTVVVGYDFESAIFGPSVQNGATGSAFTATSGTLSQGSSGGNSFAKIAQTGNNTASGQFTITATQPITIDAIRFQVGKTSGGPAATGNLTLTGQSSQSFPNSFTVPSSITNPGTTPVVTINLSDFAMTAGQTQTFSLSVTTNWSGASPGLLLDNIQVLTPVPEPSSVGLVLGGALAAGLAGGRAWRRRPAAVSGVPSESLSAVSAERNRGIQSDRAV